MALDILNVCRRRYKNFKLVLRTIARARCDGLFGVDLGVCMRAGMGVGSGAMGQFGGWLQRRCRAWWSARASCGRRGAGRARPAPRHRPSRWHWACRAPAPPPARPRRRWSRRAAASVTPTYSTTWTSTSTSRSARECQ